MIRKRRIEFEMELENSDSSPLVLPVFVDARVPELTPAADVKLNFCFLDYPYYKDITFKSNDNWGYYTIDEPQVNKA